MTGDETSSDLAGDIVRRWNARNKKAMQLACLIEEILFNQLKEDIRLNNPQCRIVSSSTCSSTDTSVSVPR